MKSLIFAAIGIFIVAQSNASAGTLICTGKIHKVTINSSASTIKVSPEMKKAVPAIIGDGPEEGLYVAYDQGEQFIIYIGGKAGKITGNLQSSQDEDLEEKMTCTGSL